MKKIGMLFALLAGALLGAQAHAQDSGTFYFGFGGGAAWTKSGVPLPGTTTDDTSSSGKVYIGSLGPSGFGWELGGYYLGKYDVTLTGTTTHVAESELMAVTVAAAYATDIGRGFTFHGRLGLAFTWHEVNCDATCVSFTGTFTESRKTGMSGMGGIGFGARLSRNLEAVIDYEHFGSVHQAAGTTPYTDGYDMFSVNLQFNF